VRRACVARLDVVCMPGWDEADGNPSLVFVESETMNAKKSCPRIFLRLLCVGGIV